MRVVLPGEADAAEDLDRGVADGGQPARECLGAQRRQVPLGGVGGVGRPQRVDDAAAREFDGLVHVDAQVLDRLEAADRLVELPAHLGVFDGEVHHRLSRRRARRPRRRSARRRRAPRRRPSDADASRCAGASSNATSNSLRVGSTCDRGVTVTPADGRVDGEEPGAVALVGEHQQDVGRGGVGQRRRSRRAVHAAVGAVGSRPGQRADRGDRRTVGDARQQRAASVGAECASARASRRRRSTATGPGCSAAPSSSATTPASTIVMPAPPCSSATSTPVAPRCGQPAPHLVGGAGRIVEHAAAHGLRACLFGEEAAHGVPQRDLFVGEFEVHCRAAIPRHPQSRRDALVDLRRAARDRQRARRQPTGRSTVGPSGSAEHVERQRGELLAESRPTRSWPGWPSRARHRRAASPRSTACRAVRGS